MKKLKLFMAAFALLLGWSNAWAQNPGDDMTSYITNPTFTNNADGWTIDGQARYYNGKGFDGTTNFIELTNWGSSWDATISQTVTVPNGYYRVKAAGQMSGTSDCWMKLVANGAESRFSRNGDTNGNILANGTETTIGSGVAGWRYTSVIAKVTDGSLAISCVGHSNVAERWANFDAVTLTFLGTEFAPNTDVTEYISNWDFWGCFNDEFNGWTIAKTGGNSWVHGNTAVEHWSDDMSRTFDFYQAINNLPDGRYQISASMWNTQGTPNGNSGVYGTSSNGTVFAGVTVDCDDSHLQTYTTNGIFVNDGTLRLGVKNNGARSTNWFGVDWIKLLYVGKVVADYAVALPAGGAMEADTWYYFDIAVAGDNYLATASDLSKIICTDDGNTLTSAATGNVTLAATDNNFAAKRYYVKSSSANNLEIGVASYTYTVSEASADKTYIQSGQTVTVSYTVSTNDPGATLDHDYSGVTFDEAQINVTPGASGFTFTVPANLTANTEHTLYIPAGAIGYDEGTTYNAEQSITLKTPAIFDGIYFLKAAATYDGTSEGTSAAVGKYLARGLNYGTHATLDKYGLPVQITTNGNNETTIQAYDTKRYFFHANTYDCYADQASLAASSYFTVTLNNGKLLIHNNSMAAGTYLKYNTSAAGNANIGVYDDGNGTNSGPIIMWTTEDASAHATAMQSYKDAQAATAAAAAYASGNYASLNGITTVSALEAELEANYIKGDFVSPSAIESISEKYQGGQPGSGNITETVYSNTINITEPGFYKFSMQAFYRAASNEVTQAMHTNGVDFPPVVLFFGDSETQIKSIYDDGGLDQGIAEGYFETETVGGAPVQYNGKWYTNGQHNSVIIFQKDYYHNDVYFYASEPGEYTYGVKYMGWACANAQWFIYSPESVEITSYAAAADAADYTALQNAIDAYDDATWGFETGEYAPYNNVEAINNIDAAKAINQEAVNSKLLVNSLTTKLALSDANASEVNAVYDGTFAAATNNGAPAGWTMSNNTLGGDYHSRAFVGDERLSEFNGTNSAFFQRYDGTNSSRGSQYNYGNTTGYTMPLKAATTYRVTVDFANWNAKAEKPLTLNVDGPNDFNASQTKNSSKDADTGTNTPDKFDIIFTTTVAGNYVLRFQVQGSDDNAHNVVVSNIELKKIPASVSGTITPAGWASFSSSYPLDLNTISDGEAYYASASDGSSVTLTETTAKVPANTGLMIKGEPNAEFTIATTSDETTAIDGNLLKATDGSEIAASPASDAGTYHYVFGYKTSDPTEYGFYNLASATSVEAGKAYLEITKLAQGARSLRISLGGITEVENVEAAPVATVKKNGAYLENGKIAIYKNGMKFSATGAKLK